MKNSRLTDDQIILVLKQAESGLPVQDVCRSMNISAGLFYAWREKNSEISSSELERQCQIKEDNLRLKKRATELRHDIAMLQDILAKKLTVRRV